MTAATASLLGDRPALRAVPAPPSDSPGDFASRLAAVGLAVEGPLEHGELVVDLPAYLVTKAGEPLDLSPRQVELLALFLLAPRRVWSREHLHWICWGDTQQSRRVDVQLCRLRGKTGIDLFRNVRDRGWVLRALT